MALLSVSGKAAKLSWEQDGAGERNLGCRFGAVVNLGLRALQHELSQKEERAEAAWVFAPKGGWQSKAWMGTKRRRRRR